MCNACARGTGQSCVQKDGGLEISGFGNYFIVTDSPCPLLWIVSPTNYQLYIDDTQ